MGKVFNMVGGGGAGSPDLPIGSRINVTSDIGATIDITKGSLHYQKTISASGLPSEYQEVEYVESNGNQWINTMVTPNPNLNFELSLMRYNTQGSAFIFGASDDWLVNAYALTNSLGFEFGTTWGSYSSSDINVKCTVKLENKKYYVDDTLAKTYTDTFSSSKKIYLFACMEGSTASAYKFSGRIYHCRIYDSNNVNIRNLVPCYRISDSVIGMYDTVNDVFYENAGSGTFSKGADITQGTVTFTVNYSGTWTIKANKTGETELTDTVSVLADDTDYPVSITFWDGVIYYSGDEHTSITGSIIQPPGLYGAGGYTNDGNVTKNPTYIYLHPQNGVQKMSAMATANKLNLNRWNTLNVTFTTRNSESDVMRLCAYDTLSGNWEQNPPSLATIVDSRMGSNLTATLNISAISSAYIGFGTVNGREYDVFKVWLS